MCPRNVRVLTTTTTKQYLYFTYIICYYVPPLSLYIGGFCAANNLYFALIVLLV